MFVDAFTVQYLQHLRDVRKNAHHESNRRAHTRITPIFSIFAGIILLICSLILVAAKHGNMPRVPPAIAKVSKKTIGKIHIKAPHLKVPKFPQPHWPKNLPKIKLPALKFPKIDLPSLKVNAQMESEDYSFSPVIAAHYQIKKLYSVDGVKCADGRTVTLWQRSSHDGRTIFGSIHGERVVGSIRSDTLWQKGGKMFSVASYNTNQHGIIQVDPVTRMVEKINPGDGCLFTMKCANVAGTWKRDESIACAGKIRKFEIRQDACNVVFGGMRGYVKANVVMSMRGKKPRVLTRLASRAGSLRMYDRQGCTFVKSVGAHERV